MPEFCTCGAKLPEDARFCHKCGKPQRDEPLLAQEPEEPPPPPPAVPERQFPPIGFHNGPAVRIALLFGLLSLVMLALSGQLLMPAAFLIWLIAAGFLCVRSYRRRTGQMLTMAHGAHLGWICGLFVFAVFAIFAAIVAVGIAFDPSVLDAMRDQIKASAAPGTDVTQALEVMRSPTGIAVVLLVAFLLFTALPAFGGAIGAKLLDRELKPPL